MKKYSIILVLALFCLSCSKDQDSILIALQNSKNHKEFVEYLKNQDLVDNSIIRNDNTPMNSLNIILNKNKALKYSINIDPDGYNSSQIREILITIPNEKFSFRRNKDTLEFKRNHLMKKYESLYGIPDTIIKTTFRRDLFKKTNSGTVHFPPKHTTPPTKILQWDTKDYTIELANAAIANTAATVLSYEIKNFDEKTRQAKEFTHQQYTIEDWIDIPNWTPSITLDNNTIEFNLWINGFWRKNKIDDRHITALRFDVEIRDVFDQLLFSYKDVTMELPTELTKGLYGQEPLDNRATLNSFYSQNDTGYNQLINVIEYKKTNKIITTGNNIRVLLDDGTIITKRKAIPD